MDCLFVSGTKCRVSDGTDLKPNLSTLHA